LPLAGFSGVESSNVTARHPLFEKLVWNEAAEALLGTRSDRSIAKLLGVHPATVRTHRHELGIPAWRQSKHQHQRTCVICGEPFTVVGGRLSQMRTTCPPPKKCTAKLIRKQRKLGDPAARLRQVSALLGMHFITDKDD
jgi:hypothetical protein